MPHNYGNAPWVLSRAERKLGCQSDLAVFEINKFYKSCDINLHTIELTIPNEIKRLLFLRYAIKKYDVFHFNYASTIWDHPFWGLNYFDLSLIKKAGKKIIVTYQGDDARQKDFFIKQFGPGPYDPKYTWRNKIADTKKRLRIKKIEKYANYIFAYNPDLMHVLPKKTVFMPYPSVDLASIKSSHHKRNNKIKIVHAPSVRMVKGTDEVITIIKKLSKKYPLELILIENIPHRKAMECYAEADIAIDQLKIGWYGGFAVETMAMGIPTISFLRESDLQKFVPFWQEIPIVNADKNSLEDAMEILINNRILREKIGRNSRKYVIKYHNPLKIAKKMIEIYKS